MNFPILELPTSQIAAEPSPDLHLNWLQVSTIGELPLQRCAVSPQDTVQALVNRLLASPDLPGALVIDRGALKGVISREKCFEQLGRPFGVEVFNRRTVAVLLNTLHSEPRLFPSNLPIDQAVQWALSRPAGDIYEPLVVETNQDQFALLDLHILLLAQSQLLTSANKIIRQQAEISRALSKTLELNKVLKLILEEMTLIVPYDRAAILLQNNDLLEYVSGIGYPPESNPELHLGDLGRHPYFRQVLEVGTPLVIQNMAAQSSYQPSASLDPAESWLGIPLSVSEKVIGLLSVVRTNRRRFLPEELTLIASFAGQSAIALENARLYEETRRLNNELEEKIIERTSQIQIINERLIQVDRTRTDILHVVSSELWRPLNSMGIHTSSILADIDFRVRPKIRARLEEMKENITRIQQVVSSLIDIARLDQQEISQISVHSILSSASTNQKKPLEEKKLRLEIETNDQFPSIEGDEIALYKVFNNLVAEAVKRSPHGGAIQISIKTVSQNDSPLKKEALQITIQDQGESIEPDKRDLIFSRFSQRFTGNIIYSDDAGLELAIVRAIVEAHNGAVWVDNLESGSPNHSGNCFQVLLPIQ